MDKEFRFKSKEIKKRFEAENYDDDELRKFVERPLILSKRSKWRGYVADKDGIINEIEVR